MERPSLETSPRKKGIPRLIAAARNSMKGFRSAFGSEEAFRLEVLALVVLTPLACWIGDTMFERALLIAAVLLVIIVELLNTAIEAVVDRVGTEFHTLSGMAKDVGSAAVLVAMVLCALVWAALLWDRFL